MHTIRTLARAFTVAVAAAWMLVPATSSAGTLTCTPMSLSVAPDTQGNLAVSCTDAGTPPPPTTCAITVSPSSSLFSTTAATVTGTLVGSAACGSITSWSAASSLGAPTTGTGSTLTLPAVATGSPAVAYAVTVTVSGTAPTTTTPVTVNPPSVTPPPPPGTISCSGYSTQVVDILWSANKGSVRVATKGFTNGMIVVGRFTTPNVVPAGTPLAKVWGAESNSTTGPIARSAALSLTPCDFPSPNPVGGMWSTVSGGTSPSVTYQVNGTSTYYAVLAPNTTYYFNIKNEVSGRPTCPAQFGSCDMFIEVQKPSGW